MAAQSGGGGRPGAASPGDRLAPLAGLAASALAFAVPLVGARARPGYSHVSQFISELGERGAPSASWVSAAGFAPIGLLVLLFLGLAGRALPASRWKLPGLLCLAAVGAAYLAAWLAPCDPGCPATGSLSQTAHNTFGALEYVGASAGLVLLGASFRGSRGWASLAPACAAAAVVVAAGFFAMLVPSLSPIRGLAQRIAEGAIFLWIAAVSVSLLRARGA
jgi:hypothetical membrane protein